MCIWSKIRAILGWSKFVSAYVERDKKILKLAVFGVRVTAHLIEIRIAGSVQRIADRGRKNTIPKILRYSFIVLVFLINRKDYEPFICRMVF